MEKSTKPPSAVISRDKSSAGLNSASALRMNRANLVSGQLLSIVSGLGRREGVIVCKCRMLKTCGRQLLLDRAGHHRPVCSKGILLRTFWLDHRRVFDGAERFLHDV